MNLKNKVIGYLIDNPIDDSARNKYASLLKQFKNLKPRDASRWWAEVRDTKLNYIPPTNLNNNEFERIVKHAGDTMSWQFSVDDEIKSVDDLVEACDVDLKMWEILSFECRKWDVSFKNSDGELETKPKFAVNAKFKKKKVEENLDIQKDIIVRELFDKAPQFVKIPERKTQKNNKSKDNLLEIALFDMHFGKLSHRDEVGEDYDLKIAEKRWNEAIEYLLSKVDLSQIEKILLPVGNDLLNVDNNFGTTTAGTPQDNDTRFHKVVKTVKRVLIETINKLSAIAPVDVVMVPGNHDTLSVLWFAEILEAYYVNSELVRVYNQPTQRKYYQYGVSGFLFSHGDKEKHNELGMIFAAENPHLWANTEQRYIQLGHFHHNRKISTLQTQEYQGFQVQIIPSLSGSDAYHNNRGYISLKQAKAFIYNKADGLVGELTYTVKNL